MLEWFFVGVGSVLAPDDKYNPDEVDDQYDVLDIEEGEDFWQIFAPDPNYQEQCMKQQQQQQQRTSSSQHGGGAKLSSKKPLLVSSSSSPSSAPALLNSNVRVPPNEAFQQTPLPTTTTKSSSSMSISTPRSTSSSCYSRVQQQQLLEQQQYRELRDNTEKRVIQAARQLAAQDSGGAVCTTWTEDTTTTNNSSVSSRSSSSMAVTNSSNNDNNDNVIDCVVPTTHISKATIKQFDTYFVRICLANTITLKKVQKQQMLDKLLQQPVVLLTLRSNNQGGAVCPNGYTLLMISAITNHIDAAQIIINAAIKVSTITTSQQQQQQQQQMDPEQNGKHNDGETSPPQRQMQQQEQRETMLQRVLYDTNLQGKTALHLAGEKGHIEMVRFLKPYYQSNPLTSPTTNQKTSSSPTRTTTKTLTSPPPVDLTGRTPLGVTMTSPDPKARRNRATLFDELYTTDDLSIVGINTIPTNERIGIHSTSKKIKQPNQQPQKENENQNDTMYSSSSSLDLVYATAQMPGRRVLMEDYVLATTYDEDDNNHATNDPQQQPLALFVVCDGHTDHGYVSKFVAKELYHALGQDREEWSVMANATASDTDELIQARENHWLSRCELACENVDDKLRDVASQDKNTSMMSCGGSTAIFALITTSNIIVGNVGDCRCILIQHQHKKQQVGDDADEEASTAMQEVSLESPSPGSAANSNDNDPAMSSSPSSTWDNYTVIAMSQDHKPNLPDERRRIKNAGLSVIEEKGIGIDGNEIVYSKVVLRGGSDRMAISRTFGDYEYKNNDHLDIHEQAVIPMPDVYIHNRTTTTTTTNNNNDNQNDDIEDAYLVLACDGVWDVMTNDEVGKFIVDKVHNNNNNNNNTTTTTTSGGEDQSSSSAAANLVNVADALLKECLHRGSADNMSVIIVALSAEANHIAEQMMMEQEEENDYPNKALNF